MLSLLRSVLILLFGWSLLSLSMAAERVPVAELERLADVLENPELRTQFIQWLRAPSLDTTTVEVPRLQTFSERLAELTQSGAQNLVKQLQAVQQSWLVLVSDETELDLSAFSQQALQFILLLVAVVFLFWLLRWLAQFFYRRLDHLVDNSELLRLRSLGVILVGGLLDLALVGVAWALGYGLALALVGMGGELELRATLFLNAFLMVEVVKVLVRVFFAPRQNNLRVLPMASEDAAYWNAWLARLLSFVGYGVLLVVPWVAVDVSLALSDLLYLMIQFIAVLYAFVIIVQNRRIVAQKFERQAERVEPGALRLAWLVLARSWHMLAILYLLVFGMFSLVRPEDALLIMFQATVQMVVAITVGAMLSALFGRALGHHGYFSAELHDRYPTLEARLNDFIPQLLKGLRGFILLVVVSVILDAWNVFKVAQWLASDTGTRLIFTLITVLFIILAAKAFWIVVASWIEHRLSAETGSGVASAREKTLLTIFRNAIMVTLIILTTMVVLSELGLNIGPLIAGAGVVGLAIGFGAQKLVQDIITGVFIQMENAIHTGDIITVAGITGTAEKLTIRSLGLRDLEGTYHFIPFSSVDSVSNYMRDFAYHVGYYGIAYRESVDEAIAQLQGAFASMRDDFAQTPETANYLLTDELAVDGVNALADSSVNIRVRIKTRAGVQWAVGRAFNGYVKKHFDAAGIEIPFPHTTLYFGEDKAGLAPAAPVRWVSPNAD